jgi:hypothetical protein
MSQNAGGGLVCRVSANEDSCAHGAQINFGDLTPYIASAVDKRKKVPNPNELLHPYNTNRRKRKQKGKKI